MAPGTDMLAESAAYPVKIVDTLMGLQNWELRLISGPQGFLGDTL